MLPRITHIKELTRQSMQSNINQKINDLNIGQRITEAASRGDTRVDISINKLVSSGEEQLQFLMQVNEKYKDTSYKICATTCDDGDFHDRYCPHYYIRFDWSD